MTSPRFLYLHGFASGPSSTKARAFEEWGKAQGLAVEALDLRLPSLQHLRFSSIKTRIREAIGSERDRAVLIGSSLGGLAACRVAEEDARVCAVFAMAPAFRLVDRWRTGLGPEAWEKWRRDDSFTIDDHVTKTKTTVDFGFVRELEELDVGVPDVRVPVCIVHGERDDVVPIERSRTWSAGKNHVQLIEVDDTHELGASIPRILTAAGVFLSPFTNR